MNPASRNALCPCGSGKRYKMCHGAVATDPEAWRVLGGYTDAAAATLSRARTLLAANDLDAADAECRYVLAHQPHHATALWLLAHCEFDRQRPESALELALQAAKELSSSVVPSATRLAIWTDLNYIFDELLVDVDRTSSALRRADYTAWRSALPRIFTQRAPLVSVVLVIPGTARCMYAAITSVVEQRYPLIEVVIVHANEGVVSDGKFREMCRNCPFPYRLVHLPNATEAALANRGVSVAKGDFVNVLIADHMMAGDRIGTLVEEIANRSLEWGFSNVAFVDERGTMLEDSFEAIARLRRPFAEIGELHSLGHAFIHREFVAVGVSNLFFSRSLFIELKGFQPALTAYAWDFALRALELAEPGYSRSTQYLHRLVLAKPAYTDEEAQVAIFVPFYLRACEEARSPRNRWAPSLRQWRTYFLKRAFDAGHVLMFTMEQLERLAQQILIRRRDQVAATLAPGMELIGFAFGEFGLGESLRLFAHSCAAGAIPFSVKDVCLPVASRQGDLSMAPYAADRLRYRCAMFCVNPDTLKLLRSQVARVQAAGGYRVGYWYWELSRIPREWEPALDLVDEIWVASEFVADAVRRTTGKPVVKIPPPIVLRMNRGYRRDEFRLPDDRFLFLFSFDYNSFSERKNPKGAIAAFQRAFPRSRRDVGLVIKSTNAASQPVRFAEITDLIGGDSRIIVMDQYLSRDQVFGLQSVVDAYVSLHRAEGLGLGLAESMYLGKPVIGTGYSGNLEFMTRDNSLLVDYNLVPVRKGEYLHHHEEFEWADPDLEQAARWMQRLADDAAFRTALGRRGEEDIRTRFTYEAAAVLMKRRLVELGLL
jgi:glycosyltransferase involved in cell wall biosynthesis